jgi:hypothetical protein
MNLVRPLLLSSLVVVLASAGCSKLGGHGIPSMPKGTVDPNACGGYASSDVGAKLKVFLQATKDLEDTTAAASLEIKTSCVDMGKALGLGDGDLKGDDPKAVCDKVIAKIQDNLKVGIKGGAHLKASITPGHCELQASASASAGAACSGEAAAGTGGSGANGQCAAAAKIEASVHAECTPPQVSIEADASVVVDKPKVDATIAALKAGLPRILTVSAKIAPIKDAFVYWAATAKDLAASSKDAAKAFADQAICVGAQIGAAAKASAHIEANINVSVSVSASASGSVGG